MKLWGKILIVVVVLFCGGGVLMVNQMRQAQIAAASPKQSEVATVDRGPVTVEVVETGGIEASRVVELKSRAAGRLAKLLKNEGDSVAEGELIALIDPTETRLQVEQNRAQLRASESGVARQRVEIQQREVLAQAALDRAVSRLAQLEQELVSQPIVTKTAIQSAEAALATAREQLKLTVEITQPNERIALESEVEQATLNLENAERERKRLEELLTQDFVSRREVDAQRLQVDLARSRKMAATERLGRLTAQQANERRQAQERVRQAESDLERARANRVQDSSKQRDVDQARIAVREARANLLDVQALRASLNQLLAQSDQVRTTLQDSERQLGETEIRAPFSGVITRKLVQEGELVASLSSFSSGTPIVRLEDRTKLIVRLRVNEIDIAKLAQQMPVDVSIDAFPTRRFEGKILSIAPARTAQETASAGNNAAVVRYEVEVQILNPTPEIKSGMTAQCTMKVVNRTNVLRVPIDFVIKEGTKRFVMVLPEKPKPGDKGTKTEFVPGAESASHLEVKSGLSEGVKLRRPEFTGPARAGARFSAGD